MTGSRDSSDGPAAPDRISDALDDVFREGRLNAILAWCMIGILGLVLVESLADRDLEWIALVAVAGAVVLVPPVSYRNWRVMLPWELLVLALLPILVRGLLGGELGTFSTYVAMATLALAVVVELHMFTSLELTHWFAIVFVVLTTLAWAGASAMLQYAFDLYTGTSYLTDNAALMEKFVWVTLAGFAAGLLFDAYFRRRDRQLRRAIGRVIP